MKQHCRTAIHVHTDDVYDDYDLIQGKDDACKPAQYIVTSLQTDYIVNYKNIIFIVT